MDNNLAISILKVCEVLNNHSVQYMIVGGTAVALYGYFRRSTNLTGAIVDKPDLDFWYNPTYDNYFRLLDSLEELGQNVTEFKQEPTPNPKKSFFKYEFDDFTLDLLPELKAPLKFRLSFEKREVVTWDTIDIVFISFDDLIADKEVNSRPKDLEDIQHLRNRRE